MVTASNGTYVPADIPSSCILGNSPVNAFWASIGRSRSRLIACEWSRAKLIPKERAGAVGEVSVLEGTEV